MRVTKQQFGMWVAAAILAATAGMSAADDTFTGTVGDAMCGLKHKMEDAAECTKACALHGDYALLTKDKVYTLKVSAKLKAELDKLAGHEAQVSGSAKGDTIQVTSIKATK